MILQLLKWTVRLILAVIILSAMSACTMLGLNYASLETENRPEPRPVLDAGFDPDQTRRTLEAELYGPWPENLPITVGETRMIDDAYLGGRGTLEEIMITIGSGDGARTFPIVLAVP
ncbi:MAG: hypothetical protein VX599_03015, partial [Pseudomonadota bacterium]|nr:hypothetical protein [Pseudomonadota bacterium]